MSAPALAASRGGGAGDSLMNKFLLVRLAFQRAQQLQNGARPRLETDGHKFLWVATHEVMAGMVSWDVPPLPAKAEVS